MQTTVRTNVQTYNNFIDGDWVPSRSGQVFENRNPADREDLIGYFQESSVADAEAAIAAARRAYVQWRLVPAPKRAEILFKPRRSLWRERSNVPATLHARWARCSKKRGATSRKRST